MNNTTTARKSLTTIGQEIEVEITDFTPAGFAAGLPKIWVRATVVAVAPLGKLFNVSYRHHTLSDKNGDGLVQTALVGPRGGGKTLRLV